MIQKYFNSWELVQFEWTHSCNTKHLFLTDTEPVHHVLHRKYLMHKQQVATRIIQSGKNEKQFNIMKILLSCDIMTYHHKNHNYADLLQKIEKTL